MTERELRKLDKRVAKSVFGMEWQGGNPIPGFDGTRWPWPPPYSTDMNAAWMVVEKLTEEEYVKVQVSESHYHGSSCRVVAADKTQMSPENLVKQDATVMSETAPIAICLAALKAIEEPK